MNSRKWTLVLFAGLLLVVSGVMASTAQASLVTTIWGAPGLNQSHDTDAEIALDSSYNHLNGSTGLQVGDYLVGGINYGYNVPPIGGSVSYGLAGVDQMNVLFVLKIADVSAFPGGTNSQGIPFSHYTFVAPSVAEWTSALNSVYGGAAPAAALKTAEGSVGIVFSNPTENFQQLPIGATSAADVLNRVFSGPGVTNIGELGFTGGTTTVNGGVNVGPNATGEGWQADGPTATSSFVGVTYGSSILNTNIIFGIDPTAGSLLNDMDFTPILDQMFPGAKADFAGTAELQGTGDGLGGLRSGEQMDINSGGAVSFYVLVPEPASCAVWSLIMGCVGLFAWRRRRS